MVFLLLSMHIEYKTGNAHSNPHAEIPLGSSFGRYLTLILMNHKEAVLTNYESYKG